MNKPVQRIARSACPHDCPSVCALDVEIIDAHTIGRVRGAKDDPYTAGVICEKVARYAERIHHPDRLMHPLRRVGAKGAEQWQRITWDAALDEIARRFSEIEAEHGPEAVWPYNYAGTMGYVQRDSLERLRNGRGYSRQFGTICTMSSWPGYIAGTGLLAGVDPGRDGGLRRGRHLGYQCGAHPGQCHDPRHARQKAWRAAGRHRHLPQCHNGTG